MELEQMIDLRQRARAGETIDIGLLKEACAQIRKDRAAAVSQGTKKKSTPGKEVSKEDLDKLLKGEF